MRQRFLLLAAICACTQFAAGQDSKVQRMLIIPSGQAHGSFLESPTGLSADQSFTFPSTGGMLLVSPSSGVSNAWLLGGNDVTSTPTLNKIGTTSAHDLQLVAGGAGNVRLTLDDALAAVTVNNGGQLRLEEAGGPNFTAFVVGAQTTDITYRLPLTAPTANQVLRANATTPTDLEWATLLINLGTDVTGTLPILNGGTGATDAATARTNLGLAIGTDVQAYDADLTGLAAMTTNGIIARNGTTYTPRTITGTGVVTVTNGDGVSGDPTISLTGVASVDPGTVADQTLYWDNANSKWVANSYLQANGTTVTVGSLNGVVRATSGVLSTGNVDLLTETTGTLTIARGGTGATDAATARTNLGLAIGTDVQAYDADLTGLAAMTSNGIIARNGTTYTPRTITGTGFVTVTNGDGVSGDPTISLTGVASVDPGTVADQTLYWDNANSKWVANSYLQANGTTVTVGALNGVVRATSGVLSTGNVDLLTETTGTLTIARGGTGATDAATARTNLGLAIGTDVQAYDADLAAVAGLATTGLMVRTGAGTATTRTLSVSSPLSITNANGVGGDPAITFTGELLPTSATTNSTLRWDGNDWVATVYQLPPAAPTAGQVLRANSVTPTTLEWATLAVPAAGTLTNSTLRWSGSAWEENTTVRTTTAGDLQADGDISLTDATTSSVTSNRELVLRQNGDTFGWSQLKIQHRNGANGAIFETQAGGGAPDLVDFGFKPGSGPQSNMRLEFRSGTLRNSANTAYGEFQFFFGTTTTPQYAASFGTAATSFEVGNVSIGHRNPSARFTVGTSAQEFRVNNSGDLIRINNVPYTWPAANAVANGYALTSTTAGALSWSPVQAGDADLTALAGLATNGILVRTGAGTAATRTISVSSPLSITNGDGVGGDPAITFTGELLPTSATSNSTLRWDGNDWIANATLLADGTNVRTTGALDVDGNLNVDGASVTLTALPTTTTAGDLLTIDGSNVVRRITAANAIGTAVWAVGGNSTPSSGIIGITNNASTTDLELYVSGSAAVTIDDASKQVSIANDLFVYENTTLGEEDADQTSIRGSVNINTTNTSGLNVNINTSTQSNTTTIGNNTVGNRVDLNAPVITAGNLPQTGVHTDELVLQDGSGNLRTATINGTADQISVSSSAGAITIGTPQNIATTSTPTFASMTLSATSNQLTLGTTNTTTISATAPAASRTYTLADVGADADFVLSQGAQTINGAKSFRDNMVVGGGSSAAELRITEQTGSGDHYSAFKVGAQANDITYTLPDATPAEGQVMRATTVSGTNVTMSWTPTVTVVRNGTTDATNNDVTLQNATELAVSVSANTNYTIDALIRTQNSSGNHNMDVGFTLPSGTATFSIERADANGGESAIFDQAAPVITNVDTDAAVRIFRIQGVAYVGGTGGTIQLVFKRVTNGVPTVQILDGSYLSVTR